MKAPSCPGRHKRWLAHFPVTAARQVYCGPPHRPVDEILDLEAATRCYQIPRERVPAGRVNPCPNTVGGRHNPRRNESSSSEIGTARGCLRRPPADFFSPFHPKEWNGLVASRYPSSIDTEHHA